MLTTLIDNQKSKVEILTQEEKKQISLELECLRYVIEYLEENRKDEKKLYIIEHDQRVDAIKEIFTNIKKRVEKDEEKLEEVELLEKNVLRIINNSVQGIDYWEDVEALKKELQWQNLESFVSENLIKHSETNDRALKRLEEISVKKKKILKEKTNLEIIFNQQISAKEQEIQKLTQENKQSTVHLHQELDQLNKLKTQELTAKDEQIKELTSSKSQVDIYWMIDEPEESLERVKNGELDEVAIEMIENLEQAAVTHMEAIAISEKMNKEIAGDLKELVREKSDMLHESDEEIKSQRSKIEELQKLLEKERREKVEIVKDFEEEVKNLQEQKEALKKEVVEEKNKAKKWKERFRLATKSLPSLPKRENKLKTLKEKTKAKSQYLIEKVKHQSQELIAKIEIRTK